MLNKKQAEAFTEKQLSSLNNRQLTNATKFLRNLSITYESSLNLVNNYSKRLIEPQSNSELFSYLNSESQLL